MKKEFSDIDFEMFVMPFGKHIKKSLTEIPASYLLWIVDQGSCPDVIKAWVDLHECELQEQAIEEDLDVENNYYEEY